MIRSELNLFWSQTILYYCGQQINNRLYDKYATSCGKYSYDEIGDLIIIEWYINDIAIPNINTLLNYNLIDVNNYYYYNYLLPNDIKNSSNFYKITTEDLNNISLNCLVPGLVVYNLNTNKIMFFNGSIWVDL